MIYTDMSTVQKHKRWHLETENEQKLNNKSIQNSRSTFTIYSQRTKKTGHKGWEIELITLTECSISTVEGVMTNWTPR